MQTKRQHGYGAPSVERRGAAPGCGTEHNSLHVAAWSGDVRAVSLLLAAGFACDARDHYGRTPLHDAAAKGHVDVAELLLGHGADVNARDRCLRMTPLHCAASGGHAAMVALLLDHGAHPHLRDQSRNTAEMLARRQNHHAVLEVLRANGRAGRARRQRPPFVPGGQRPVDS